MTAATNAERPDPDSAHRADWRPFEDAPGPLVFLVGAQRSGTTWLHLMLARTGAFRFVSAYDVHAAQRGTLVHDARLGRAAAARAAFDAGLGTADRGIDAIPAGADTPEEYGLALGDGLRYGRPDTTPETLPRLRDLVAKKALLEGRDRPLLLKSPPDTPDALPLLAATWPGARFVALQRHPLRVLQSQVTAWRRMVARENPYLARLDRGYRDLLADPRRRVGQALFLHSPAGVAALADSILAAQLGVLAWLDGGGDALTLRYEDLCADPSAGFDRIAAALGIALPRPDVAAAPRVGAIAADVRAAWEARLAAFAPALDRFGYGPEPPDAR